MTHLVLAIRMIRQRNPKIAHVSMVTRAAKWIADQRQLRIHIIVEVVGASSSAYVKITRNAGIVLDTVLDKRHRNRVRHIMLRHSGERKRAGGRKLKQPLGASVHCTSG